MLKYNSLQVGDEVHWNCGECGDNIYTILEIGENVGKNTILLIGDGYSEFEVFLWELS